MGVSPPAWGLLSKGSHGPGTGAVLARYDMSCRLGLLSSEALEALDGRGNELL
jgi:hypothetical protein